MKNPGIKFGIIALVITIVWTFIEHFMGYNTTNHETGQYARMLGAFIFYVLIFVSIYSQRKHQNGVISFAQGFRNGLAVSVTYGLGVTFWYALYGEVINKEYKPTLMAFERAQLEAANTPADVIAQKMKQVDLSTGGSVLSYVLLFVFMTLIGIVITLIASFILKRRRPAA